MTACILIVATNKYIIFCQQLIASIEKHFLNGITKKYIIFTNHQLTSNHENIRICTIDHEPWPMPTLKRYHYFLKERDFIASHDYCFYFDADMRVVSNVGQEVLGDTVATQHPGYWNKNNSLFTYERNRLSTAYISEGFGNGYYAGGFNGGKASRFIAMSEEIHNNIEKDLQDSIVALWHDESHLNKFFYLNPPTIILSPSYCFPESALKFPSQWNLPFVPKILALDKDHAEMRT